MSFLQIERYLCGPPFHRAFCEPVQDGSGSRLPGRDGENVDIIPNLVRHLHRLRTRTELSAASDVSFQSRRTSLGLSLLMVILEDVDVTVHNLLRLCIS